jgi:hypothetical protein
MLPAHAAADKASPRMSAYGNDVCFGGKADIGRTYLRRYVELLFRAANVKERNWRSRGGNAGLVLDLRQRTSNGKQDNGSAKSEYDHAHR